jgi:nucleoside-diphosphate-sugar epimerase
MTQRVLLLGGTGAIGVYLIPELLQRGFIVDVTSRIPRVSKEKDVNYIEGNARDMSFLKGVLRNKNYDVIIDFMIYGTDEFRSRHKVLLGNCRQYIFLSSYRVFAEDDVITESSPRILDVNKDEQFLKTDEYALTKARQEDILRESSKKNWTIVRPSITYSKDRFQFGTLEANSVVWRSIHGMPVPIPKEILNKKVTMTWAGDTARIIAKLTLHPKAYANDFNIATNESQTWSDISKIYSKVIGMKTAPVSLSRYIEAKGDGIDEVYLIKYNRLLDRAMDNSKVLKLVGETQDNFITLREGLGAELRGFIISPKFSHVDIAMNARFDKLTNTKLDFERLLNSEEKAVYEFVRYPWKTKIKRILRPRIRLRDLKKKVRVRTRVRNLWSEANYWFERIRYKNASGVIVTLSGYYNYGNLVQRYALQEFLRQNGYNFTSYWFDPPHVTGTRDDRFKKTASFVDRYIWTKTFDHRDNFPTYIVGSDQVWRSWHFYDDVNMDLGYYFLNFVNDNNAKRIAYAASIGKSSLSDAMIDGSFIKYAKPLIDKFDAISMREESGVKLVEKTWGVKAEHVLDPTMLLTSSDYTKLINQSTYILDPVKPISTYVLSINDKKKEIIDKIVDSTGMEINELNLWDPEVLPPVEQWLKGFSDAKIVITDSFHGTVFSIINNTNFVVIENADGGVARMTSLLNQFGLENRLIAEDGADSFDYGALEPINWEKVNKRWAELQSMSGEWLLNALK